MDKQTKITIGLILLLVVVGAGLLFSGLLGGLTLSIAGSCTDFMTVPDVPSCTTDAQCISSITGGQPMDDSVIIKCNAGTCQAKLLTCEGEVSP